MATITTQANPTTFGFETGVIPSEYVYSKGQISPNAKVVDVATLPAPFNIGTTSPRAWRQPLLNGDGSGYLSIPLKLNAGSSVSVKVASSITSADSLAVYLINTSAGTSSLLTLLNGEQGWASYSWAPGVAGNYTLEFDFTKGASNLDQGKFAAVFMTDIAVSASGYLRQAATTGTSSPSVGPFSLASRISMLATRLSNEISGVRGTLGLKAPLDSPILTGTPTAPTAPSTDVSTTLANTTFVSLADNQRLLYRGAWAANTAYAVNDVVQSSSITYVCKTAHTSAASFSATNWTILGYATASAPLASPTFTGDPKAPTATAGDNDTSIATTAFVQTAAGTRMLYRGAWSSNSSYALNDVVFTTDKKVWVCTTGHTANATFPTSFWTIIGSTVDTSTLAPLASPVFTGDPTVPDPAAADNDFSIANTGWVTRLTGTAADWVTQFNNALTPATNALAATTTVPGIIQLATTNEALNGVEATHALTAAALKAIVASDASTGNNLQLVNIASLANGIPGVRVVSGYAALNALSSNLPAGALAVIGQSQNSSTKYQEGALWQWNVFASKWNPITPIRVTDFTQYFNAIVSLPTTYPNLAFEVGISKLWVARNAASLAAGWDEYAWNGTTFVIMPKLEMRAAAQLNGPTTVTANTFSNVTFDTVLSDPTGLMAPTDSLNFRLPWKGRYAINLAYALNGGDIPATSFVSTVAVLGNGYIIGQDARWGAPGDQRGSYADEVSVDPSQTGQNLLKFQVYYQGSGTRQFSYGNDSVRARASVRFLGAT